jgi:hypothetical protein
MAFVSEKKLNREVEIDFQESLVAKISSAKCARYFLMGFNVATSDHLRDRNKHFNCLFQRPKTLSKRYLGALE